MTKNTDQRTSSSDANERELPMGPPPKTPVKQLVVY